MSIFITKHARENLLGRSQLHHADLRKLVAAGVYMTLGRTADTSFVLLYAPTDNSWLVLPLSLDGNTIISVWEDHYVLPAGVRAVTPALKQSAKQRYQDFVFAEYLEVPDEPLLQVTLRIADGTEHRLLPLGGGHVIDNPEDKRTALGYLRPHLKPVVADVAAKQPTHPVWYTALFRTPDGDLIAEHTWRHNKRLRKFFNCNE